MWLVRTDIAGEFGFGIIAVGRTILLSKNAEAEYCRQPAFASCRCYIIYNLDKMFRTLGIRIM